MTSSYTYCLYIAYVRTGPINKIGFTVEPWVFPLQSQPIVCVVQLLSPELKESGVSECYSDLIRTGRSHGEVDIKHSVVYKENLPLCSIKMVWTNGRWWVGRWGTTQIESYRMVNTGDSGFPYFKKPQIGILCSWDNAVFQFSWEIFKYW